MHVRRVNRHPVVLNTEEIRRAEFLDGLNVRESIGVEIGALNRPLVRRDTGATVIYVDHTNASGLREKYRNDPNVKIDDIVEVDAVWGTKTLHEAIGGRFVDYVVASHVVEHVPDLIGWLRELAAVLRPTGEVRLAVPDKRFTFDYFRRETRLEETLLSFITRTRVPHAYSLLDYCLSAADVDLREAWKKPVDRSKAKRQHTWQGAITLARDSFENGAYHDVHCWAFTPHSFARLLHNFAEYDLLDFACERFRDTKENDLGFSVVLRRSHDRQYIAHSWERMARAASNATPGTRFWQVRRKLEQLRGDSPRTITSARLSGKPSSFDPAEPFVFPPNFDPQQYLAANPDVSEAGADPVAHYRRFGWKENRPLAYTNQVSTV